MVKRYLSFSLVLFLAYFGLGSSFIQKTHLIQQNSVVTTTGGTTSIAATDNQVIVATGSSVHTFKFPDATTLISGTSYDLLNNATSQVTVQDNNGITLAALKPGQKFKATLSNNSSNGGVWRTHVTTPEENISILNIQNIGNDFASQYLNTTRGDARYYKKSEFISDFTGLGNQPVITGSDGKLAAGFIPSTGAGSGTVTSAGLSLPVDFVVTGSPVTTSGTLTGTYRAATANLVFAGPTSGGNASPAFRSLVGGDLPNPSASTLGGVQSIAVVANNFLTGISTSGVPSQARPTCSSLSDSSASCSTDATNATNLTSGSISGARLPAHTGDVTTASGTVVTTIAASAVTNAKMANMSAHTFKGNNTGSSAAPLDLTQAQLTAELNQFSSTLQGVVPSSGGGSTNFLRADGTWTVPSSGTNLDGTFRILNTSDNTKQLAFSAANISAGTTRTVTATDNNVDLGGLDYGFQNYVSQVATLNTTTVTGTPAASSFYSNITNRGTVTNFLNDLKPRIGIDRVITQGLTLLPSEAGPNNAAVYGIPGDSFNQVRFVGVPTAVTDANGYYVKFGANTSDFLEVVCFCTGLNVLTVADTNTNPTRGMTLKIDGGAASSNIIPGGMSNVLQSRNTPAYQIITATNNITQGIHTFTLTNSSSSIGAIIYGFEVLNETTSSVTPAGTVYGGLKTNPITTNTAIAATSSVTGTAGGRVLVYAAATGTVTNTFTAASGNAVYLQFATHANEEIARIYTPREFGVANSTVDFDSLAATIGDRSYILDDNSTALLADNLGFVQPANLPEGVGLSDFITITFTGTGLDIQNSAASPTSSVYTVKVDNTTAATGTNLSASFGGQIVPIVSGLKYGTHVVTILKTAGSSDAVLSRIIAYQPKTPQVFGFNVPLAAYNVVATFAANATQAIGAIATGVIRKSSTREALYNGTWTITQAIGQGDADHSTDGYSVKNTSGTAFYQQVFWGTGFDLRVAAPAAVATNATISVDGSTNFTTQTTSFYGCVNAFTVATGVFTTTTAGTSMCGVRISGFSLGLHTVKVTYNSGTAVIINNLDVIQPIHAFRTFDGHVGGNSGTAVTATIQDLRNLQPAKNLSGNPKLLQGSCFASGINSGPTTTSTVSLPAPDMTCVVSTVNSRLHISYSIDSSNSAAGNINTFQVAVDGLFVGLPKTMNQNVLNDELPTSDTVIVPVSPGIHIVKLYWKVSGGTGTASGLNRNLSVMDF